MKAGHQPYLSLLTSLDGGRNNDGSGPGSWRHRNQALWWCARVTDRITTMTGKPIHYLIGTGISGSVFGAQLSLITGIPLVLVRKKGEDRHSQFHVEGYAMPYWGDATLPREEWPNAVFVDDLISSGATQSRVVAAASAVRLNMLGRVLYRDQSFGIYDWESERQPGVKSNWARDFPPEHDEEYPDRDAPCPLEVRPAPPRIPHKAVPLMDSTTCYYED